MTAMIPTIDAQPHSNGMALRRNMLIAVISFLTLVDLFAAQAILPSLTKAFNVSPTAMSLAVNASTVGMAIAGLAIAWLARGLTRRTAIWISLAVLAIPTTLLASTTDLGTFAALRVAQGLCMSAAFTLTIAYLAEHCTADEAASALAAYVTGNVACNLFGRLLSASVADGFGIAINFYVFAALNLAGAAIVYYGLDRTDPMQKSSPAMGGTFSAWAMHLSDPGLRAAFAIGFLILFVFIGTFTYVGFELRQPPLSLGAMQLGLVYFVFLPSILTTPWAGAAAHHLGTRPVFWGSIAVSLAALPLMLMADLNSVLSGLALLAAGTFFAQAAATAYVSRAATMERGAASGLYLASYYIGGLAGTAVLGPLYQYAGWQACVAALGVALIAAAVLAFSLRLPPTTQS
ncbi:MAG TPA: MFS transporter [Alphaproteobacteria bacterium]|nr:MFS transporter [Alphaproteobacteria bacterium]HAJ48359.1 MFS transporter [Alphaproteobacteria bacterium]